MRIKEKLSEAAAAISMLAILVGLPAMLWSWKARLPSRYPPGTKVITLTATAREGIWTLEEITGSNYWLRGSYRRAEEIPLKQGDHVVVRLKSVDVLHSFAIPLLRIGPVEVPAGHVVQVEFDADRPGRLLFLCWQVCSPDHGKLKGHFVVEPAESSAEGSDASDPW